MILTIEDVIQEVKTNISNLEMSNHSIEDKLQIESEKIKLSALESYGTKRMKFNTNIDLVHKIMDRVKINEGHCPCDSERTEDNICPCEDMDKRRKCHCSLFI